MDDLPLKFLTPGDTVGEVRPHVVVSTHYSGFNFRGALLSRNAVGGVWSAWTTNAHGRPSEVRQGTEAAAREKFAALVIDMLNGK